MIIKGIPFRCITSTHDYKSSLLEPVPYWSGNVTLLRRLTGFEPTCHFSNTIQDPKNSIERGEEEAVIHTLEYHHCRPPNFPGWSDEEYRKKLRELFELVESCKQENRKQVSSFPSLPVIRECTPAESR